MQDHVIVGGLILSQTVRHPHYRDGTAAGQEDRANTYRGGGIRGPDPDRNARRPV